MANITITKPTDQPEGKNRLLSELETNLHDNRFNNFKLIVAFAKISPLLKLHSKIIEWKKKKTINAIFGVDQMGTSIDAIQYALDYFDDTHILHVKGKYSPTFHPKIYLFKGSDYAIAYIGSNNLTVGGTETNFESYSKIEMNLPEDIEILTEIEVGWEKCIENSIKLDKSFIERLISKGLIISEKDMAKKRKASSKEDEKEDGTEKSETEMLFPETKIIFIPPSPLPKALLEKGLPKVITAHEGAEVPREDIHVSMLVIHINPHHNGEVFLSKNAVNQNPTFFGWPFTGRTVSKKASNPSYPQRDPDPKVDIYLFNEKGDEISRHLNHSLNTVHYSIKSEIRITMPPEIVRNTIAYTEGPYPIMIIKNDEIRESLDYLIEIYLPGSEQYNAYESSCNQSMPSGGKSIARKFGWL